MSVKKRVCWGGGGGDVHVCIHVYAHVCFILFNGFTASSLSSAESIFCECGRLLLLHTL